MEVMMKTAMTTVGSEGAHAKGPGDSTVLCIFA